MFHTKNFFKIYKNPLKLKELKNPTHEWNTDKKKTTEMAEKE
jgi:hypothetical protein